MFELNDKVDPTVLTIGKMRQEKPNVYEQREQQAGVKREELHSDKTKYGPLLMNRISQYDDGEDQEFNLWTKKKKINA